MQNNKIDKKRYRDLFRTSLKELGDELRQARLAQKLSLEEVYWETNIFPKKIDLLESGMRFNIAILRQLAKFYHMNVKISLIDIEKETNIP